MNDIILKIINILDQNVIAYKNQEFDKIIDLKFIRNLSINDKIEAIKLIINYENNIDPISIFNIRIMLLGLIDLDDEILNKNDNFWFTSLLEYTDIVFKVNNELNMLSERIFYTFLGILKTMKTHLNEGLDTREINLSDKFILEAISFSGLSNIIKRIDDTALNIKNLPYIIGSEVTLERMCNSFNIMNFLYDNTLKMIEEKQDGDSK